ncbi:MAG: M48 family metallopeptidase [Bacteroidota bacterium]
MSYFNAGYYDGESSRKYSARIFIDNINNGINIEPEGARNEIWLLHEITVDHAGNYTEIKHRLQPGKSIQVEDLEFGIQLRKVLNAKNYSGWYHKLIYAGTVVHVFLAVSILGLIAATYWWVLPEVAEKATVLLPESYDKNIGNNMYENVVRYEKVNEPKTQLISQFADQINFNGQQNLRFTVVDSKEVNAFALPDGNIIVYSGILKSMDNYSELVALMSHESAHVSNRHSIKLLCRNLSGYLFLSVVMSDVNGIMAVIADNANTLRSLSYSRSFEEEADRQGVEVMIKNKVDPHGMISLFEKLKENHKESLPGFISTHPLTDERINYINKEISSKSFSVFKNEKLEEIFNLIN